MASMTKEQLRRKIREEGAPAAYNALMRIFENPSSSPTALASAARTMMDLSGLMKGQFDEGLGKEPHEMTPAELQAAINAAREARNAADELDESVFG